ncbi:MAG: lipopolysaccharide heptosyltransferase II [Candidatus Omnitrophota bacterium]
MRYKKILIWEVNWIGDVLFTTPFIKAVRDRYPDARIVCIVAPRAKELLETNPHINEIIEYDEKTVHKGLVRKLALVGRLRREKFDIVFLLHRSMTRALICLLGGVKRRVGYSYKKRNFLLTHRVREAVASQHRIEYFLGMARKAGADEPYSRLELYLTPEDVKYADGFFKKNKLTGGDTVIAVNPGGNWDPKRWPPEKYAELCDLLIQRLKARVVVTGAEKDIDLYLKIQELMKEKMISLCGSTTLRQMAAVFKKCSVVLSGDSGPLHIALAMRSKAVALFGPTSPSITGPYGDGDYVVLQHDIGCKVPCYNSRCRRNNCMRAINSDEVFSQVRRMLNK